MTLREIDEALDAWNQRLSAAAQNLFDLQGEPVYQQLTGTGGLPKASLSGATRARVETELGAMSTIFQHFGLLHETIESARKLRKDLPSLFGADQKLKEIEELLQGKSIHLPPVDVPFEQRTLLSGVRDPQGISPDDLLAVMVRTFQASKDAVVAVDRAWHGLGKEMGTASAQIRDLRERAAAAGVGVAGGSVAGDLDEAERLLAQIRARVHNDPLGVSGEVAAQLRPALERAEQAVTARERVLREIADGLTGARRQFDLLSDLHRQAVAACAEARAKIADCSGLQLAAEDSKIDGLRGWLARLEEKRAAGMFEPVLVGLRNWNNAAAECVAMEREALAANRGPVETRNELRGRLDALKAKARARGVAEEDALAELARGAEELLYTRPTAIDRAGEAVREYERRLNGRVERAGESGGKQAT